MFSEIYGYRQSAPWQTYSLMFCAVMVTVATIVFPNLQHVFGSFDENTGTIERVTIPFQHGFDTISALIYLVVDLVIFAIIGIYLEKLIGGWNFFILNLLAMAVYVLMHITFNMTGHGGVGLYYAYTPVVFYTLNEGRLLKTRSVFDEFYSTLRIVLLLMFTVIPVLLSIIPIYFNTELPIYKSVFLGNLLPFFAVLSGMVFLYLFRENIRLRMKQFAKKKKFEIQQTDKYNIYLALIYPLIIFLAFILAR